MFYYFGLLSIVFAVSIDGLSVGITYGLRKITMSFSALFVIVLCSGIIVTTSMGIGHFIRKIISPNITSIFGSIMLICLGLFVLFTIFRSNFYKISNKSTETNCKHDYKKLSYVKSVLDDPRNADKDKSGSISIGEAFILGIVLALDAVGAGLGAAMLGYPTIVTAIFIAVMSGTFLYSGIKIGRLLSKNRMIARLTFLPPLLLISLGIINLL